MTFYGESRRMARLNADKKAWDGLFYAGWRKVRAGGRIKAAGCWYQDDQLLPFISKKVYVRMNDYWQTEILVYAWRETNSFICKADTE